MANKIKIETVVKTLEKEYESACKKDFIYKPMSYAIYQTWKKYNAKEKPKKRNEEE